MGIADELIFVSVISIQVITIIHWILWYFCLETKQFFYYFKVIKTQFLLYLVFQLLFKIQS